MANLTLKGVPEPVVQELKKKAAANRRSLNGEVLYRLESSLAGGIPGNLNLVRETQQFRRELGVSTTVKEILTARDKGRR